MCSLSRGESRGTRPWNGSPGERGLGNEVGNEAREFLIVPRFAAEWPFVCSCMTATPADAAHRCRHRSGHGHWRKRRFACRGETYVVRALDQPESGPARNVATSKSPTPISIETSATLKIQMKPSFDALNMSITAPNRIRSRAFPIAPAMTKANPTVLRRSVACRATTRTRMDTTARFNAVSPQRVSSPDTGTRPNALL